MPEVSRSSHSYEVAGTYRYGIRWGGCSVSVSYAIGFLCKTVEEPLAEKVVADAPYPFVLQSLLMRP